MPCSRIDAPFAQCAPRLIGESNTGSCRVHTPFWTTASIAQPTEQCVQTVRLTSTLPSSSFFASAWPIMLKGSCEATAPAPTVTPERLRNVRRSMVFASTPESPRDRRVWGTASLVALRVSSMWGSSNLGSAVVVVHVLGGLIAARSTLVVGRRNRLAGRRFRRHDRGRTGCATRTESQQEIAAGETLAAIAHWKNPLRRV